MTELPEPEWEPLAPTTERAISRSTWIIALGALATFAGILAVYKASVDAKNREPVDPFVAAGDDWRASFQHLADAIGTRLDGIGERLDDLEATTRPAPVPEPVELATEPPPPIDPTPDAEPFPAPAPAHVSMVDG